MNDRSIHLDLLDQVERDEHRRAEIRRILGPDLQRDLGYLRDFDRSPRQPIDTPDLLADDERGICVWRWAICGCLLTWAVIAAAGIAIFA